MKLSRHVQIGIGIAAVIAVVVGVIAYQTLSAPKRRTVVLDQESPAKRGLTIDQAAARKEIDRRIAEYRAKGEPILVADFKPKPIDPKNDAAVPFLAAIEFLDQPQFNDDAVWSIDLIPRQLTTAQWEQIDAAMKKYAPALALIDQADGRDAADWKIEFKSPAIRILLRSLNGARHCANLLRMAALSSHRAGRHDETVRRLTQMTRLARHVDNGNPALVGHLVASGISRLATETVADVAPTLLIAPASGPAPEGAATRAQADALIAAMLDPRTLEHGWRHVALAERMFMHDSYESLIDGRVTMTEISGNPNDKNATTVPTPPAGELLADLGPMLDYNSGLVTAARAERLPEYRKLHPPEPAVHSIVSRNLLPTYDRAAVTHYAALAELRLAATAIALRAYAADHGGALPASLSDLVPNYLPAVPADPLVAAPATILLSDGMVYSAGVNERTRPAGRSAAATKAARTAVKPDYSIRVTK